ncbi:restriction endonuclease subunit S [Pseudomonas sp. 8O]|uniref:restriction endonuclease subunit S n=1 Tax=Pseudomonas sp. 8O TaxID=2653165 RepID=UPI0012EFB428|nr:restriction endonuclease subunit S [Pseudomonas sp. 8O]VXB57024.1 Restriction endonuclease [Pseudomonas sp. 8O]
MSFPAYPVCKDSGVDWLGEIPKGWSIKPLWALFRRHKLTGFPDEQLLSVYRDYGVIPKASRDDNFNKPSDDLGAYQLVQVGDLAINKMKAWQGSVGISSHKGIVSPAYHVYAPGHSEAPQYLHHLFRCNEYIAGYLANSKGIRVNQWDLEPQQHSRMAVLLPSFQEQNQIARFLDHETARIDALIEEQQRLIELLKEKRQAVISRAVTKGLDPTVPMKDSGVEWLGEVPAHWIVRKVSVDFLASKGPRGALLTKEYCHEHAGEYPVYSGQTENGGILGEIADFDIDLGAEGAVLSTTVGAKAMSVMHISGRISLSQNCMIIRPLSSHVKVRFFFYHFQPLFSLERRMIPDHMQPSFRMEDLYSFRVAVPPVSEQNQIAEYLDAAVNLFDELIGEGDNGIALLQERRSALISAAVTGKIDVRGWQPPASSQAHEPAIAEAM